ncbi:hypothetical protein DYI24_05625 [Rhodopseudomonas sp. BR0C11]|uniref:hypothetical protein n=1 Tax=Rhodopseudomonas sp. BR0C11 TaxID=2269370 RepID=UPI0013DEC81E|nr:hypothetical protein [Rhodopseudomonas sp. BR0C11]NEV76520.1 hypothetical protein [Rhodopseudomonas sp. BR0C11]
MSNTLFLPFCCNVTALPLAVLANAVGDRAVGPRKNRDAVLGADLLQVDARVLARLRHLRRVGFTRLEARQAHGEAIVIAGLRHGQRVVAAATAVGLTERIRRGADLIEAGMRLGDRRVLRRTGLIEIDDVGIGRGRHGLQRQRADGNQEDRTFHGNAPKSKLTEHFRTSSGRKIPAALAPGLEQGAYASLRNPNQARIVTSE